MTVSLINVRKIDGPQLNQAEQMLKGLLEPVLREQGFKPQSSYLGFRRRTGFGFQEVSIPSFAYGRGGPYVLNVGLGVRHTRIDDVVNRLGHIWGEANQRNTTTVYRGLGFFPFDQTRDGETVLTLDQLDKDVRSVASSILEMLSADGFEFFRQYSDARQCSIGLNEPIASVTHPLLNNFPLRGYYGVAAAGFTEPERVPALLQAYAGFASQNGGVDNGVYKVGNDRSGTDAIVARLEFVAEAALSAGSPPH